MVVEESEKLEALGFYWGLEEPENKIHPNKAGRGSEAENCHRRSCFCVKTKNRHPSGPPLVKTERNFFITVGSIIQKILYK